MTATHERTETFEVLDDHLIRKVVPARGRPYEHRCPRASFEQIAHAIDELGDEGFTLESLVEREGLPFTQVAVALAFLKERGMIETRYRRNYPATDSVHLDAMTEFWALAENG
jgi:predicted Rossmann fold nucleotide-binding protein DprA/Smf involved in DNA uptake